MPHAPAAHGQPFERIEHEMLDEQTDHDDGHEPREHTVGVQLVTVLEDVSAEAALPRARTEHQVSRDERAVFETDAIDRKQTFAQRNTRAISGAWGIREAGGVEVERRDVRPAPQVSVVVAFTVANPAEKATTYGQAGTPPTNESAYSKQARA